MWKFGHHLLTSKPVWLSFFYEKFLFVYDLDLCVLQKIENHTSLEQHEGE